MCWIWARISCGRGVRNRFVASRFWVRRGSTAAVAVANAVSEGGLQVVPDVLVTGGGGAVEGLAAALIRGMNGGHESKSRRKIRRAARAIKTGAAETPKLPG